MVLMLSIASKSCKCRSVWLAKRNPRNQKTNPIIEP